MATTLSSAQLEHLIDANAAALGLHIASEHRPGVAQYYQLAADMAELVIGLRLGPEDESAAVFAPVAPEVDP